MGSSPVATTPTQPAKDEGQAGRGRPRGGGQARCYIFLGSDEAVAPDNVATGIVAGIYNGGVWAYPRGGRVVGRREEGDRLMDGAQGGKGTKEAYRLRIRRWNIGTLTGKYIELAKILKKRKVSIACVQETRWVGSRASNADGYKLWFSGSNKGKNGVGILVDRELRESVVEVKWVNDILMEIKLVVGGITLNVIITYAPQASLDEEVKRCFWEGLDGLVHGVPLAEKLFIGGNFNGHIGFSTSGYGELHGGFGFGDRNGGGTSLLDFARALELVIANSSFTKREEHLVSFRRMVAKIYIDYLLLKRCDRWLCEDCKVIPSESLATQYWLLVMDVGVLFLLGRRGLFGVNRGLGGEP
ncbi:uncharacterized protein [Nicotiana tomentosiformis]|uniref:uncharacterized protein n=1 Tax=Nicotiana tomentosiformis TaxID=4098 RepID=UPI00388C55DA